jgi:hypothetical protein
LPSSQRHPAWWSNNPSNNPMTRAWLDAGYRTERVDTARRRVVFRRHGPRLSEGKAERAGNVVERLQAALGGTVSVAPGVDLTEPAAARWDAEES